MLTLDEKLQLEKDLVFEHKRVMKKVLNMAGMAIPEDKFNNFRTEIFNSFGKSGLETETGKILDKYTEENK